MKFIKFIKIGITLATAIMVIVMLMSMSAFALDIGNSSIFTDILLIMIIAVQLLTASVLVYIYEALKGGRKK